MNQLVCALKIVTVDRNLGFFLKFGRSGGFEEFLRVVEGEETQRQFVEIFEMVGRLGSLNVGFQNLVRERMVIKVWEGGGVGRGGRRDGRRRREEGRREEGEGGRKEGRKEGRGGRKREGGGNSEEGRLN